MNANDLVREMLDLLTPARRAGGPNWESVLLESAERHRVRSVAAIAFFIILMVFVATPALGLRDQAVRLFGGSRAPEPVQEAISPLVGGKHAKAYVRIRTSVGAHVTLLSAEDRHGQPCTGLAWEGTGRKQDVTMSCERADNPRPFSPAEAGRRVRGSWIALVFGTVRSDVERVDLVSTTGAAIPVPLSSSHYLVEVPRWAGDAYLIAYGYGGIELGRRDLETPPSWTPPEPFGQQEPVLVRVVANRTWTIFNYEATGDRRCYGVATAHASGSPVPWEKSGGDAFRCVTEREVMTRHLSVLGPDIWPSVRGSDTWVSVVGAVSDDVALVRVKLASGDVRDLRIQRSTFAYIAPADVADALPQHVVAFNSDGARVAEELLR